MDIEKKEEPLVSVEVPKGPSIDDAQFNQFLVAQGYSQGVDDMKMKDLGLDAMRELFQERKEYAKKSESTFDKEYDLYQKSLTNMGKTGKNIEKNQLKRILTDPGLEEVSTSLRTFLQQLSKPTTRATTTTPQYRNTASPVKQTRELGGGGFKQTQHLSKQPIAQMDPHVREKCMQFLRKRSESREPQHKTRWV